MKNLFFLILAGIVAIINACTYSESGFYFVDPVPGEPPVISVTTNLDTINNPTVIDSLEVVYDVEIENGKFYQVEAYVVNQMVYNSDTTSGSFWLTQDLVQQPGIDTLFIFFFYSTNSNSLADIVELEFNVIELDYPIIYEEGGAR